MDDLKYMALALAEARQSRDNGGIPIGSALVVDGTVIGLGHNQRIQKASVTLHAEMDALENAGRLRADQYRRSTLYTTLSPCSMCAGAILLYKIPRVVIGENRNFTGEEELLKSRGVEITILDDPECREIMQAFIAAHPDLWHEDIGER